MQQIFRVYVEKRPGFAVEAEGLKRDLADHLHLDLEQVRIFVKTQVKRLNLKSKSVCGGCVELNYEVRLKDDNSAFVNQLEAMPGVSRVVLVSYNGDYMG